VGHGLVGHKSWARSENLDDDAGADVDGVVGIAVVAVGKTVKEQAVDQACLHKNKAKGSMLTDKMALDRVEGQVISWILTAPTSPIIIIRDPALIP
jgi:hypothetical protein